MLVLHILVYITVPRMKSVQKVHLTEYLLRVQVCCLPGYSVCQLGRKLIDLSATVA
jgi:hypothetical protein